MNTTYSFTDVSVTISHPDLGQFIVTGEGVGSINTSMSNDRTVHDVAADGSVMVTKIKARNGVVTIQTQQTSALNKWLMKWYNYLEAAPTNQWARTTIVTRAVAMGETIKAIGVSPQKLPDKPYQSQGQQITWSFMAADIQQDAA